MFFIGKKAEDKKGKPAPERPNSKANHKKMPESVSKGKSMKAFNRKRAGR